MFEFISKNDSKKLFVLFHGTGVNEFSLLFLTGEVDPSANVLGILGDDRKGKDRRYFKPLTNGVLDQTDFFDSVDRFLAKWDKMVLNYKEITFIGYSDGANFIQGILTKRPNICNRTILLHPQEFNVEFMKESTKSENNMLITTSVNAPLVIQGNILSLTNRLKKQFSHVLLLLLDDGYGVTNNEVKKDHKLVCYTKK